MSRIAILITVLSLVAAAATAASPKPAKSEFFETASAGFLLEKGKVAYGLTLKTLKPLPEGAVLEFAFDNPKDKSQPITETTKQQWVGNVLVIQSIPLECIFNGAVYRARTKVYSDSTRAERLGQHEQKIEFMLPRKLFKKMGVRCR